MRRLSLLVLLAVGLLPFSARAHDYWLEFQPLHPARGGELDLSMWVGEDFVAEKQKQMQLDRTFGFRLVRRGGSENLLRFARDNAMPLLRWRPATAGGHILALERGYSHIEMRARKFNKYLVHEGLAPLLAERRARFEHLWRARERYSRYLKAFVQIGDEADGVSMQVLNLRLEIVPDRDLASIKPGEKFGVAVRFEGRPVPGLQVEAFVRTPVGVRGQKATTDASGRAEFTVEQSGAWLVRTVHMQRCLGCSDADWESFWAGYTFAVR